MAESLHSPSGKAGLPPGALVHVGAQPQTAGRVTLISYGPDHCIERKMKAAVAVQRKLLEMMYILYKTNAPYDKDYFTRNQTENLQMEQPAGKD